jgi:hypothetical protein
VGERSSAQDASQRSTTQVASTVTGKNVNITSGRDVLVKGSQLTASQDVTLRAGQDLVIASAQNTSESSQGSRKTEEGASADILRGPLIGNTTQAAKGNTQSTTQVASTITGRNITAQAARDATLQASKLLAEQNITLAAQRNTFIVAAANLANTTSQTNSNITSTILSMEDKTRADTLLSSTAVGSELVAGNKIEVGIGNAALLSAAQLTAPSIAFTRAAGVDTTTDAQLILDGAANTLQVSRTEKGDTLGLWQSATGAGKTEQTLTQTSLKGSTTFDPTLKISVTLPAGELKTQLASLSTQPGMDYLATLAQRDDVNWQGVKLAHDKWDYAHDGLTPAGAMVVAAVVAYFTAGAGSAAVGTASTTTATATTAAATTTTVGTTVLITSAGAYTAAGLAINAGFTALASQAAISMINTQGDIGKTLDQLGKEESIKNLVFTMLTAGALGSLSESLKLDQINAQSSFTANVGKNAITNLASASMDAALNGKPLNEEVLSKALSNALIAAGAAQGAHAIGDAASGVNGNPAQINAFTQSVAHALLGCAIGSASTGSGAGCSPGAVGAVVGELSAKFFNPDGKGSATDTVNFAKTMASLVGAMSGGGTQAVSIASMTGGNAAENNFLGHIDKAELERLRKKAQTTAGLTKEDAARLVVLNVSDQISDELLMRSRNGEALSDTETKNLKIYLGAFKLQNGDIATRNLIDYGVLPDGSYPFAGTSTAKSAFTKNMSWADWLIGRNTTTDEKTFNAARTQAGLYLNTTPNEDLTPVALEQSRRYATLDALINSPVLGTSTYLLGTATGANQDKIDTATQVASLLSDIGSSFVLPRTGVSPVMGETTIAANAGRVKTPVSDKPVIEPYQGDKVSMDGHKIYDPAYPPLSTNKDVTYRFSDPTYRPTGGDVYMGENAATSFFEVRKNINGKSLYVGQVEVKNVLDLTNPETLRVMNIDSQNLTALVNAQTPADARKAYQYTNQIANQAFDAGYTGILYPSSRNTTGTAVVLFGGRYDPNAIKPILNIPVTTPPQKP